MEDRKQRFEDKNEVRGKIAEVLKKLARQHSFFDGTHIFTPHADVPDDGALRLVVLPPENIYARDETTAGVRYRAGISCATTARSRGIAAIACSSSRPTTLVSLACAMPHVSLLAWDSIVEDVKGGRLNIDLLQKKQAEKELETAADVLPRVARECYKWLLCPVQQAPTDSQITIEAFPLNTSGSTLGREFERVCSRQRTGDHYLVADPSAHQAEGALLEV